MDSAEVATMAAEWLPRDEYRWTVEPLPPHGSLFTTHTTSQPSEQIKVLDSGTGAFVLSIGDHVTFADFGYEDDEAREVMREQLGRVRAYLDGLVTRSEKMRRGRLIATQVSFPDGLTLTMHHGGCTSLIDRIFGPGMSSATVRLPADR